MIVKKIAVLYKICLLVNAIHTHCIVHTLAHNKVKKNFNLIIFNIFYRIF